MYLGNDSEIFAYLHNIFTFHIPVIVAVWFNYQNMHTTPIRMSLFQAIPFDGSTPCDVQHQ